MIIINVDKLWNESLYDNNAASFSDGHGFIDQIYNAAGRNTAYADDRTIDRLKVDDSAVAVTLGGVTTRVFRGTTGESNGTDGIYGSGANGGGQTGTIEKVNFAANAMTTPTNNWTGINRFFKNSAGTKENVVFTGGEDVTTNTTDSWTRYVKYDDSTFHLGFNGNEYLTARARGMCGSNGLDALIVGGVTTGPSTAATTAIEKFRPGWTNGDQVFMTTLQTTVNSVVKSGFGVSTGCSFIYGGGRNLTIDAVSTTHTKMKFDDTAVVDYSIPTGGVNRVVCQGAASGDEYYQVGGYDASGTVYKYKESDSATATVLMNTMRDRQLHASMGAY